ncbi:21 kDa protein-like [Panicum miliaceum]|uniref:21 kDa protein-like n=1 Tax=Panicum miliaceum TaxID=4540 RepID=A0A3L6SB48_PANMI|nr:21 kDa protein-like [Panicum miliaceum]
MALRRRVVVSMLPLLLLALSMSWCCSGGAAARPAPSSDAVRGFVRSWCAGTEYPALCDATLAPYAAAVGSSPASLSWAALTVTLGGARAAAAAGRLAPAGAEAARDCVSMLGDAEDLLRQAAEAMAPLGGQSNKGGRAATSRDVRFQVDSVQAWASAALTDDGMCVEGFRAEAAGGGGVREAVRGHVARVAHLTANALGIVNAMAKQMP